MGPKVQVPGTTDVFSEDIVSPLQSDLVPSDEHPCSPEVFSEPVHTIDNNLVDLALVSMPNRYELPLRSTRGVPQRDMTQSSKHKGLDIQSAGKVMKLFLKVP